MTAPFDAYAHDYDHALNQGLAVSGESRDFFLHGRVAWLKRRLNELRAHAHRVLDYGCGTGTSVGELQTLLGVTDVVGVDLSSKEIAVARRDVPLGRFFVIQEFVPSGDRDLVYCNGVFHHVPIAERPAAIRYVFEALRPGGLFALWENNPWNPGTRYVMSRIPFDHDAITLSAPETRGLMQAAGFEIVNTDFLFVFPRILRPLRALEPRLARFPLGAQYMVLGRKPA
jgi:SAM-dependent methyltransferase